MIVIFGTILSFCSILARDFSCARSIVAGVLRQHCTWRFPLQCCLEPLGQLAQGFDLCNVASKELRQNWTGKDNITPARTLCNIVREVPNNIAHEKFLCNVVLILLGQHCNVVLILRQHCTEETLCNVVLVDPDNIAQEKTIFNAILILLGQESTGKTFLWNVFSICEFFFLFLLTFVITHVIMSATRASSFLKYIYIYYIV